jgi:uncharacterized membrane protein
VRRVRATVGQAIDRRYAWLLAAVLLAGLVGRILFALNTAGVVYDLDSLKIVAGLLHTHPGTVYQVANANHAYPRWPYPPGFFPIIWLCRVIADHVVLGDGFETVIRFPTILADIGIAFVVQEYLRIRGQSRSRRLAAAALVALGPSFAAISGIHGQIDADGILPVVLAVYVWERRLPRRALIAGVLIGVGAMVKSVPGVVLLALIPTVDSRREAFELIGAALAVALVAIGPYVIHDGIHWFRNLDYNGGIGLGSLSLVAQPSLALNWLHVGSTPISGFSFDLLHASRWVAAGTVLCTFAVLVRARPSAPLAAAALYLTVYAFGVTFFMQYMVWGLPFLLMAGYIWQVAALEALLFAPVYVIYHGVTSSTVGEALYIAPMLLAWASLVVGLGLLLRRALLQDKARRVIHAV